MKYIKICKKPGIVENTDKWGHGLGSYSVYNKNPGYITEELWEFIQKFQTYSKTPEGIKEAKEAKEFIEKGGLAENVKMPIMKQLFERSKHTLFEFNMLEELPTEDQDSCYIRQYATFDKIEIYEWTPEHDVEVEKLEKQCELLNS